MTLIGYDLYKQPIYNVLDKSKNINKWRKGFMTEIFVLFLSIKGRINFYQPERYGQFGEQRYRQQFEKPFDFMGLNKELAISYGSGRFLIAFDPSYISKSGKKTPGIGRYWSGCAQSSKWGLEISGIAAVDVDNHFTFHPEAVQTPGSKGGSNLDENLLDWYGNLLFERKGTLAQLASHAPQHVVARAIY